MAVEVPRRSEAVENALKSSIDFLNPAIQAGSKNLDLASNIIAKAHDFAHAPSVAASGKVVESACTHLLSLHSAITEQYAKTAPILDTLLSRTAHDLLDIIVVEGLYPSLSPHVGIAEERRRHSHFYKHTTKDPPNLGVLNAILQTFSTIALSNPVGLSRVVRDRHMVDLLAALYNLTYSPTSDTTQRARAKQQISDQTAR
jgi:molybdopterin-guanine dinucleotide biosynthesis protein